MSASSKKKLRKEQDAVKLTEKQQAALKEAKKTRLITTAFVVVMAVILTVAVVVGVRQTINNRGILENRTTAYTVGEHKISNAEMNYFFMDAVNNFYSNYGSYASMFGLDVTMPLNEQVIDEETGRTWADDFLDTAKANAASVYAMADAAKAAGYSLSEAEIAEIETQLETLDLYATMYGYTNANAYLKAIYGNGASKKNYLEYSKLNTLASSYYDHYSASLEYDDAALRAQEASNFNAYSSYNFHSYYLSTSKFQAGGTTAEDGTVTYTAEETAAAEAAAKAAADTLAAGSYNSVAELDAAIAALSINEGTTAASTLYDNTLFTNLNTAYADWVSAEDRKAGDIAAFASESTTADEEGNETTTVSGYYVVYFLSSNANEFALKNVRHILVTPQHAEGEDEHTHEEGEDFSAEEKAAAKASAEEILNGWASGDATEEAFAALANEKSDDGDGTTGGLYEDVYPGQMVSAFEAWCYDDARKAGDTGIVETEYGYHIMYFVGNSETTYRDYLIEQELHAADLEKWYTEIQESVTTVDGDTKYLSLDLVLSNGQ